MGRALRYPSGLEHILNWVANWGYGAVFLLLVCGIVGLPIPDEWLLVFSGYLIWKGRFHPQWAVLAAFGGSACGISLSYTIGRTLGLAFVHRYGPWIHVGEDEIRRVHDWFARLGHWALFFGFFIPGVRHFTAILAGTSKLEFRSFAAFAWTGALVWVSTFISVGYFLGEQWQRVFTTIDRHIRIAALAVLICVVLYTLYGRWRSKRRSRMGKPEKM
jgi:membrane protein DedA with SNARE-associated domain